MKNTSFLAISASRNLQDDYSLKAMAQICQPTVGPIETIQTSCWDVSS